MNLSSIDKAIIATLVYADTKNWPLTFWEIFRYLIQPARFDREPKKEKQILTPYLLMRRVDGLKKAHLIGESDGFFFLKKAHSVKKSGNKILFRISFEALADQKWKKLKKKAKIFAFFPFLEAVLVSGSLAIGWVREESDFDLLMIMAPNRIWTGRFLISGLLALAGLKRKGAKIKNRFCLNHFITKNHLQISFESLYNAHTYAHLVPLFRREGDIFKNFRRQNQWLLKYLFYGFGPEWENQREKKNFFLGNLSRGFFELFFILFGGKLFFEKFLSRIQERRIKKHPLTLKKGGRIFISDDQIEFHPESSEKEALRAYNAELKTLGLFSFEAERDSGLL